ncbi:hypothetical protein [Chryseobacterium indoltheticum]|uniref:Four helix bundle sensory module for signal transduction n=1 Tax=Chryseobacterium indoltheticum TaxID=254 RepID=A0A3G6MWJ5_9FLAO|nr:hypothetical protein [Chryseobacterium indoltheticum]AZA60200.1 hypothetical protein EG340_03725 [Chryseobacterium indoltheticum]
MVGFLQFYKDNIGKTITIAIISSLFSAILAISTYVIFSNMPEFDEIQKEHSALTDQMDEALQKQHLFLDRLNKGRDFNKNVSKRSKFLFTLSEKYEKKGFYKLEPSELQQAKILHDENLSDYGLNSAILSDQKIEEDKHFNDALEIEKIIFRSVLESSEINKNVNLKIYDLKLSLLKYADYSIIQSERNIKALESNNKNKKFKEQRNIITEKARWNKKKFKVAILLNIALGFLLIILIFIAFKAKYLKD